jgi:MFS family permease
VGENVVFGWLLLERTDSAFVVSVGVALRALPSFVLGLPGGALVDRVDRRLLLRLSGLAQGSVVGLLGLFALAGWLDVWQILVFTCMGGAIRSLGQAARQSYAFDIVGPAQVVAASGFMNLSQRTGGIGASLGAGFLLQELGPAEAYFSLAACSVASTTAMLLARAPGQAAPVSRPGVLQGVREYVQELRVNRTLALLVLLTGAVEIFGFSFQSVLPSIARDRLGYGAEGLGLLNAVASAGGMIAVLGVSLRGEVEAKGRALLLVLVMFGSAITFLGVAGSITTGTLAVLMLAGLAATTDLLTQALVQSAVANDLRGRAMGSWVLATGLGPIGHLQIGALAATLGVTAALATNGLLLVGLAAGVYVGSRKIRGL